MFVSDFPHSHAYPRHNDALRMNDHPHDRGVYSDCLLYTSDAADE